MDKVGINLTSNDLESLKTIYNSPFWPLVRQKVTEEILSRQEMIARPVNSISDFLSCERMKGELIGLDFDPLLTLIQETEELQKKKGA